MKSSLIIVGFFILGVTSGFYNILPDFVLTNDLSSYALYLLMFLVGLGIGTDKNAFDVLKNVKLKLFLIPLSTILGSILAAAIISIFLNNIKAKEAMAIASGFGYYSLSSIFISKLCNETLGVIALLSNISREIITLLLTPFFARFFSKFAPIVSGGATSMDTTLPIITKFCGKEYALISIFHGTILTIIVPFLVTFIIKFL